jgi:outer membrane lipoprotein-sorting protein
MKAGSIVGAAAVVACLLGLAPAGGQQAPKSTQATTTTAQKPLMAEQVFKNVQVLKGIPVDEFMGTMGFFAASLSLNCTDCHVKAANDDWARYADDTPLKVTARKMVLMVRTLNQNSFGGTQTITCYTCHRSNNQPKDIPSLTEQYGTPTEDPNDVVSHAQNLTPNALTPDQILNKYIGAVGGPQNLAKLTSFVAKGTYTGFDTSDDKVPVEVYAKAPDQRTTILHAPVGGGVTKDGTTVFDGRAGWINAANTLVPMLTLTGGNLEGAKVDAALSFPGGIKTALTNYRGGFPATRIGDVDVTVIEGNMGRSGVKLYFDKQSGLLLRQLRYARTAVGLNPTQVDYSDYRDVAGVKLPFKWIVSWTDGQSTFEMNSIQANVPIDASKFAVPK